MKKIYLSPSNQTGNKFITGSTSEGAVWYDIAVRLQKLLGEYNCETKLSKPSQTLGVRAGEAKAWGADVYIAMHSNAAGTANKGAHGVEVYYDSNKGAKTKQLAQDVLDQLKTLFTSRGLKTSSKLIDCYKPAMPSIIGECGFHDNKADALLILNNKDKIAQLYCNALVKYLGLTKKSAPAPEPEKPAAEVILTAGAELELSKEPLYVSASAAVRSSTISGKYFFWGGSVVNGRIRITNSKSRVGISGQVTGWINVPQVIVMYKVKAGDTLGKIATAYHITLKELLAANPQIKNPDVIHVGELIKIPVK
jgi:N-acetylmuramoyl-L-alanine amidase